VGVLYFVHNGFPFFSVDPGPDVEGDMHLHLPVPLTSTRACEKVADKEAGPYLQLKWIKHD
jgi:hypothetical protein